MGPAGAAVGRDVLVAHVRQVVNTVDITPVPSGGNPIDWDERCVHI